MPKESERSRFLYHLEKWWSNDLTDQEVAKMRSIFWNATNQILQAYRENR